MPKIRTIVITSLAWATLTGAGAALASMAHASPTQQAFVADGIAPGVVVAGVYTTSGNTGQLITTNCYVNKQPVPVWTTGCSWNPGTLWR